jgi:hypothetical protein
MMAVISFILDFLKKDEIDHQKSKSRARIFGVPQAWRAGAHAAASRRSAGGCAAGGRADMAGIVPDSGARRMPRCTIMVQEVRRRRCVHAYKKPSNK